MVAPLKRHHLHALALAAPAGERVPEVAGGPGFRLIELARRVGPDTVIHRVDLPRHAPTGPRQPPPGRAGQRRDHPCRRRRADHSPTPASTCCATPPCLTSSRSHRSLDPSVSSTACSDPGVGWCRSTSASASSGNGLAPAPVPPASARPGPVGDGRLPAGPRPALRPAGRLPPHPAAPPRRQAAVRGGARHPLRTQGPWARRGDQ
jgi:hypothetical protein